MEFGCRDDFGKLFHVRRFDVDYIKALILDVKIPKVDAQVIAADERFSIAVDRYAVDVVGMSVCVISARDGGDDSIVMGQPREFKGRCVAEGYIRIRPWRTSTTT